MARKGKRYIPSRNYNPAVLAERYRKISTDYERSKQIWDMEKAGIRNHFSKITNFTSHDVKNAIQNMDAIISTLDIHNVTEEHIQTIKTCLNAMRLSLDDFYNLSFDGRKIEFTLNELSKLVELLNKASINDSKIKFKSIVENGNKIINQSFHSVLQVLNNLIINSITAFEKDKEEKKILIKYGLNEENVLVEVCDNACKIQDDLKEKIFEIYFSTTGGSGIGLAHASHILECLNGDIKLLSGDTEYCTKFVVKFPIIKND